MFFHPIKIADYKVKSNIFVAPLAGYTNLPTRLVYRRQGNIIAFTEMVSALGLEYNYKKSIKLIQSDKNDRPLGVQLFGPDSDKILTAFLKIKDKNFDLVDINCGCSVRKVLRSKSGAFLLEDPQKIYKIIKNLKENTNKPVSLKIRSGWNKESLNYLEVLDAAVKAGADLIIFHPRTKSMMFKGKADWDLIKIMKENSPIPVIGNGDIFSGLDAVNMMKQTNCDGIMLARGLIENPFLIEEVEAYMKDIEYSPPKIERRIECMLVHCKLMIEYFGERKGIIEFRKFIRGYLKGLPDISRIRQHFNLTENFIDFNKIIEDYKKSI